jgi:hypothetical protein
MIVTLVVQLFSILVDLLRLHSKSEREKELEIVLLRQQIRILQRTRSRSPRLSWWDKLPLAVLTAKLVQEAQQSRTRLSQSLLLFPPETVLRWHRELVRRKWTFPQRQKVGRPRIAEELEVLIVRLARENPRWGSSKIEGELLKLGYHIGRSTIRAVLKRQHIPGAPIRARLSSTWRAFLRQHQRQLLACDFFTVETLRLQTLYVLFFIELDTRRIHVAACTVYPTAAWMTQQARQLVWKLQEVVVTTDPETLPVPSTFYLITNLPHPQHSASHHNDLAPASLEEIVWLYGLRMWIEQSYKQVKHVLGWSEYQVRSDRAIRRHWQLVCCAFCFCWHQQYNAAQTPVPAKAPSISRTEAEGKKTVRAQVPTGQLMPSASQAKRER